MKFVIYEAFAEGFIKKATVEVDFEKSWESHISTFAIYHNAGIEVDEDFPSIMMLSDGTFASGYLGTNGVYYYHFARRHLNKRGVINSRLLFYCYFLISHRGFVL